MIELEHWVLVVEGVCRVTTPMCDWVVNLVTKKHTRVIFFFPTGFEPARGRAPCVVGDLKPTKERARPAGRS